MGPRVNATAFVDRMVGVMGERATVARGVLEQHGRSEAYHGLLPPDVVVFPETTREVVQIVSLCADLRMAIVPFGAGTSLEGNTAAVEGGVTIDFSRMNKVLAVNAGDMDVVVQPGITRKQLNAQLRDTGLFFPIDPGADASIGGMASNSRFRHNGGALWHHEGQCHGAGSRTGGRPRDPYRQARAQIGGGL